MSKCLTIGEAAELLGTSTYNLRYYHKEGIISPSIISENGYRLFTLEDIIHIRCVLLLRESGVSISGIKALLAKYSQEHYYDALKKTYAEVTEKIDRLIMLKQDLENSLAAAPNNNEFFTIRHIHKRLFSEVKKGDYDLDYSIKEIYDYIKKHGISITRSLTNEFYYILYDDEMSVCLPAKDQLDAVEFLEGKYLCYRFLIENDEEISGEIKRFIDHIEKNRIETSGELLLVVDLKASTQTIAGYSAQLQIRIDKSE